MALGTVGLIAWCVPLTFQLAAARAKQYQRRRQFVLRIVLHQTATIPFVLACLSLLGLFSGGHHWLALGIVLALAVALWNAWILLVEILR